MMFVHDAQSGKEHSLEFYRKRKYLGVLLLMCTLWIPNTSLGAAETVFLPVTLEYPFIQSLLIDQLYNAARPSGNRR